MKTSSILFIVVILFASACQENKNKVAVNNKVNTESASAFKQTVTFPSLDGVLVTADIYHASKGKPVIVLCLQANYSRGEYAETAPILNKMGFNCIAVDQRSGQEINKVKNETAKAAKAQNLPTDYLDAEQDIVAAVNYAYKLYGQKVILVGSSYSASLVLKVARNNPKVGKVAAFSPGEYFGDKLNLKSFLIDLDKPVFITSSKNEAEDARALFAVIASARKVQYIPDEGGYHGSKALWKSSNGNEGYWKAFKSFLKK